MRTFTARWHASLAGALILVGTASARSQDIDCNRLRAEIAASTRGDEGRATSYQRAAEKQRSEIDRTTAYSRSLGCERQQFLFFGDAPPPKCETIRAQINRMTANLQSLEEAAAHASGGNEDRRRSLTDRYNTFCSPAGRTAGLDPPSRFDSPKQRGLFDFLFGNNDPSPQDPAPAPPPEKRVEPTEDTDADAARGGPKAVCVRTCDGGFFPVSYSARRSNLDELNDLCHALCPNAEVKLYTYSMSRDIDTAIGIDGTPYSDLPAALKFEKSFDPACTCRPPGRTWAETLAEAETMLRGRKTDLIVTPEKSAEMSRPRLPVAGAATKSAAAAGDDVTTAEGILASQVPTASKESAGINVGDTMHGSTYGEGQGETRIVVGPDGVQRRVRIVAPTL